MENQTKTIPLQYSNVSYFFVGILICSLVGFHFTYTMKFPDFEGLTYAHHFHGAMLMSWFFMLIVQPLLIKYKKYKWHKSLGKVSYLLIPLLLFSIFLVTKVAFYRNITQMPRAVAVGNLSLDLPVILSFGLFYCLAMVYRAKTAYHLRFMIGTSLLMIGPGIGRAMIIFGGIPFPLAIAYALYITEIVAAIFLAIDYFKENSLQPFAIILTALIASHLCWNYQMEGWWQAFGEWFIRLCF